MATQPSSPTVGVVLLSMGNRPVELEAALASLVTQRGVDLDVVLVGNGWNPDDNSFSLPDVVRPVHLQQNVGIPEGRNVGATAVRGEYLYFYDDDAALANDHVLADLVSRIDVDPSIAVAQPRGVDPTGKPSPRRWVPRLNVTEDGNGEAGDATWFWEAVFMIRREAFEAAGGWPGEFFYGHEGIELAWRLIDGGWRIRYEPDIVVHHPATDPARHAVFYRMNARNRVWVARRNLPWPLVPLYLGNWTAITLLRVRDRSALRVWLSGFREGLRTDPGGRRPMSWKTVARLTRLGRPPVL